MRGEHLISPVLENQRDFYNKVLEVAKLGTCPRLQVGAIVTANGLESSRRSSRRVIASGWNKGGNTPCSDVKCREIETGTGCRNAIHAEQWCISQCYVNGVWGGLPLYGFHMYITHSPCHSCANAMVATHMFSEVYYLEQYRDLTGVEILQDNGIKVVRLVGE